MRKFLLCLSVLFLVSACSTTTGNLEIGTSESKMQDSIVGLGTKRDVRDKFGVPNLVFEKDGLEYYEYKNVSGHGRYNWLLPIVGRLMYYFQDTYVYRENNLFIGFDKSGNIVDWKTIHTGGTFG